MKIYGLIILSFFALFTAHAQNTYVRMAGAIDPDFGVSCKATHDKGTILLMECSHSGSDIYAGLIKTDCNGSIQWKKFFQIGNWCVPDVVLETSDLGFLIYGTATDSFVLNGNNNFLFLIKTDSSGNLQWSRNYRMSANDRATDLIKANAGGFIACAIADYNLGTYPKTAITRFDENGNVTWHRQYATTYGMYDASVTELPNHQICFVSQGPLAPPWFSDLVAVKLDESGNLIWSASLGTYYDDEVNAVSSNSAGDIFITGRSYFLVREWDSFLIKLSSNATMLLSRFYDAGTMNGEIMRCMQARDDGSCTLLGDLGTFDARDLCLINLDDHGNVTASSRYPLSPLFTNYPYSMYTAYDSGFVFTGDFRPASSVGSDAMLLKTDKDGYTPCYHDPVTFTVHDDSISMTGILVTALSLPVTITPDTPGNPNTILSEFIRCNNPLPVPDFTFSGDTICPFYCASFNDQSCNNPFFWSWEFEGGQAGFSTDQHPGPVCFPKPGDYAVHLTATNAYGTGTVHKYIHIDYDCPEVPLSIPNVFTPNGDHVNDLFVINGLPAEFLLRVFNRWGSEVFSSDDNAHFWNGEVKNSGPSPDGIYFYNLTTRDKYYHGFFHLRR